MSPDPQSQRQSLHAAIQSAFKDEGLVVGWTCAVELTDGEHKALTSISGGGHDGEDEPTVWQQIGMTKAIAAILEDYLLSTYGATEPDEDD